MAIRNVLQFDTLNLPLNLVLICYQSMVSNVLVRIVFLIIIFYKLLISWELHLTGHPGEDDVGAIVLLALAAKHLNVPYLASGGSFSHFSSRLSSTVLTTTTMIQVLLTDED